jgi:hypothetical protein
MGSHSRSFRERKAHLRNIFAAVQHGRVPFVLEHQCGGDPDELTFFALYVSRGKCSHFVTHPKIVHCCDVLEDCTSNIPIQIYPRPYERSAGLSVNKIILERCSSMFVNLSRICHSGIRYSTIR